jgi:hypothetical protein
MTRTGCRLMSWKPVAGAGCVLLAAIVALMSWPAAAVERLYSRGAYAMWQPLVTGLSNRVPASLLDVVVGAVLAYLLHAIWRVVRPRTGSRWRSFWRQSAAAAVVVAAGYLVFVGAWGLNYRRVTLRGQLDFARERVTESATRAFAADAVDRVNLLREALPPSAGQGVDRQKVAEGLRQPFAQALMSLGLPAVTPGRPKVPLVVPYFRATGIAGLTHPYGLETLVSDNLLPSELPIVIAHEWGHLAGMGSESDAGFIGVLACVRGDGLAQYSAWLDVMQRALRGLPEAERQHLVTRVSPAVVSDIRARLERSRRDQVRWLSLGAWSLYNQFLRANRVESGVRSYDEVVMLLVGTRFDPGWNPRRR